MKVSSEHRFIYSHSFTSCMYSGELLSITMVLVELEVILQEKYTYPKKNHQNLDQVEDSKTPFFALTKSFVSYFCVFGSEDTKIASTKVILCMHISQWCNITKFKIHCSPKQPCTVCVLIKQWCNQSQVTAIGKQYDKLSYPVSTFFVLVWTLRSVPVLFLSSLLPVFSLRVWFPHVFHPCLVSTHLITPGILKFSLSIQALLSVLHWLCVSALFILFIFLPSHCDERLLVSPGFSLYLLHSPLLWHKQSEQNSKEKRKTNKKIIQ